MNTKQKTNWWIDILLFAGFILAFFLDLTGFSLHQILGMAIGAVALYHLFAHQQWVEAVTRRFFGKTSNQARLYYLIDFALLGGFFMIIATGLVISSWLNLTLVSYAAWRWIHVTASVTTLLAVCLKLALHWRWIVSTSKRIIARTDTAQTGTIVMRPSSHANLTGRREFLKVMGVVGGISLVALSQSLQGLQIPESEDTAAESATTTSTSSTTLFSTSNQQASVSSSVQCNKGCSYPGHCRRYTDSNGNGRCDLGESA